MPVLVSKTQNSQQIIIAFSEIAPVFPDQLNVFSNSETAKKSGHYLAAQILGSQKSKVETVQTIQRKGIDYVAVTLTTEQSWDDNLGGKTRSELLKSFIEEQFTKGSNSRYVPLGVNAPIPSQTVIDGYIASPPSDSIIHKIKGHGGVRAIADTNANVLTWYFRGACADVCIDGNPMSTHSRLLNEIRGVFGNIIQEIKRDTGAPSP